MRFWIKACTFEHIYFFTDSLSTTFIHYLGSILLINLLNHYLYWLFFSFLVCCDHTVLFHVLLLPHDSFHLGLFLLLIVVLLVIWLLLLLLLWPIEELLLSFFTYLYYRWSIKQLINQWKCIFRAFWDQCILLWCLTPPRGWGNCKLHRECMRSQEHCVLLDFLERLLTL
jgi:hypothetical protein